MMYKEARFKLIHNIFKAKAAKEIGGKAAQRVVEKVTGSKRLTNKARRILGKTRAKSFIKEPKHYARVRTGKAARISRETQYVEKSEGPFLAGLLMPKKLKTKYNRTMRHLDERMGEAITKPGKKKGLFIEHEFVKDPLNPRKYLKHHYASISAPIRKTSTFITPALASMYVMEKIDKIKSLKKKERTLSKMNRDLSRGYEHANMEKMSQAREENMSDKDKILVPKAELEKTAAALKQIKQIKEKSDEIETKAQLEKRAQKVAFSMIEKGTIPAFKTYETFHEKVASLMEENLDVVEKALEYDTHKLETFKEVGDRTGKGVNAIEQFVFED